MVYVLNQYFRAKISLKMDPQGRNYKSILQQIWIGVISSFGVISTGMSLGFSAIALPQLQNSSNLDYLDNEHWLCPGTSSMNLALWLPVVKCGNWFPCLETPSSFATLAPGWRVDKTSQDKNIS
uniref:(California timema) hypothetical protein n=1 Tax=Timema californicum TaxID=61474 RepID=A0A7R9JEL9_TIMCA|nr:unnamed protein product [Timema californicum]